MKSRSETLGGDRIAALLLAAGLGTRMGGPKALLLVPSPSGVAEPLPLVHARELLGVGVSQVLCVVREATAGVLEQACLPPLAGLEFVVSHAAEALGPAGSILAGLASPQLQASLVLIVPLDVHPAAAHVVPALAEALAGDPKAMAAVVRCGDRGGHPVLIRREAFSPWQTAGQPGTLRALLRSLDGAKTIVRTQDARVLTDLDSASDFAAWFAENPRFLHLPPNPTRADS